MSGNHLERTIATPRATPLPKIWMARFLRRRMTELNSTRSNTARSTLLWAIRKDSNRKRTTLWSHPANIIEAVQITSVSTQRDKSLRLIRLSQSHNASTRARKNGYRSRSLRAAQFVDQSHLTSKLCRQINWRAHTATNPQTLTTTSSKNKRTDPLIKIPKLLKTIDGWLPDISKPKAYDRAVYKHLR